MSSARGSNRYGKPSLRPRGLSETRLGEIKAYRRLERVPEGVQWPPVVRVKSAPGQRNESGTIWGVGNNGARNGVRPSSLLNIAGRGKGVGVTITDRMAAWRRERRVLLRVSRAAWRLEQASGNAAGRASCTGASRLLRLDRNRRAMRHRWSTTSSQREPRSCSPGKQASARRAADEAAPGTGRLCIVMRSESRLAPGTRLKIDLEDHGVTGVSRQPHPIFRPERASPQGYQGLKSGWSRRLAAMS